MPNRLRCLVISTATALVGIALWGELVTWRASSAGIPADRLDATPTGPGDAVLVLGFTSSAHGQANLIQRWRTRIAVDSVDKTTATFVFSGAATRGSRSEAAVMAEYAVTRLGVPRDRIVLEEEARSTWENVAFGIPLLADATSIRIASNTFHALRARRYLAAQAPELAARLRRARDYRVARLPLVTPVLALFERYRSRKARP